MHHSRTILPFLQPLLFSYRTSVPASFLRSCLAPTFTPHTSIPSAPPILHRSAIFALLYRSRPALPFPHRSAILALLFAIPTPLSHPCNPSAIPAPLCRSRIVPPFPLRFLCQIRPSVSTVRSTRAWKHRHYRLICLFVLAPFTVFNSLITDHRSPFPTHPAPLSHLRPARYMDSITNSNCSGRKNCLTSCNFCGIIII